MIRRMSCVWVPLVLLLGTAGAAPDDPPPVREEVERRIEVAWTWRLTDAVDLTTEQAEKVFPLLRSFRDERRKLTREKDEILGELSAYLQTGEVDEARVDEILQDLSEIHDDLHRLELDQVQELRRILSTEQVARFIVFQDQFKRTIREIVEERRGRPRAPGPGGPRFP
jgi:Spy/CpxP family protein refolding chaperone